MAKEIKQSLDEIINNYQNRNIIDEFYFDNNMFITSLILTCTFYEHCLRCFLQDDTVSDELDNNDDEDMTVNILYDFVPIKKDIEEVCKKYNLHISNDNKKLFRSFISALFSKED